MTSGLAAIRDDDDENGIVCCGRILRVDYAVDKTKAADIVHDRTVVCVCINYFDF